MTRIGAVRKPPDGLTDHSLVLKAGNPSFLVGSSLAIAPYHQATKSLR